MARTGAGGSTTSERFDDDVRPPSPAGRPSGPAWLAPAQLPPWPVVWLAIGERSGDGPAGRSIRLWGLALDDGRSEPRPETIAAGFDDRDGQRAWERFVARASRILERRPDARWVHYSARERAAIRACADTYGAPPGFPARLEEALFELLSRGVLRALRLPPDACSVRRVAELAGFRWRSPAAAADSDPSGRARLLREIADSSTEDLLAMRAVWRWLLEQGPRGHCG